jgi:hypothetical protein
MRQSIKPPAASQGPAILEDAYHRCNRAAISLCRFSRAESFILLYLMQRGWSESYPVQRPIPLDFSAVAPPGFLSHADIKKSIRRLLRHNVVRVNRDLYIVNRNYREWVNDAGLPLLSRGELRYIDTTRIPGEL